jgi:hypothetical protein
VSLVFLCQKDGTHWYLRSTILKYSYNAVFDGKKTAIGPENGYYWNVSTDILIS